MKKEDEKVKPSEQGKPVKEGEVTTQDAPAEGGSGTGSDPGAGTPKPPRPE